jgi:predicted nucleic acid-binding protein
MRYWDTSALVPLLVAEKRSKRVMELLREDSNIVTWTLSWVEIVSALERRVREGSITGKERIPLLARTHRLFESAYRVDDISLVRSKSISLLAKYALRSADALQLASALLVAGPQPEAMQFVCFDFKLLDAASREGLHAVGE